MADAPNQTRIVNAALAELGSTERLTSIDDVTSNSAKRAKALWPDILRELLSLHPWNFAIRRQMLNASADGAAFGYCRQFKLPADCVRWLPGGSGSRDYRHAEREGDVLVSDAEAPLACRYIAYVDEVPKWPPYFVSLVILRLAASMAEGVTQSEGIKDRLLERAAAALRTAKRMDGLETGASDRRGLTVRSTWLTARNRGWHGVRG